jgi:uncharacterized protein (TIGR01777 family)
MTQHIPDTRNVLVAGGSGLVGAALIAQLREYGFTVTQLVRSAPASSDQVQWSPETGQVPDAAIANSDVVINLSGASIAGGWWTGKRKHLIRQSRIDATSTLAEAMARSTTKPRVLISASGVGYYGDQPGVVLDERAHRGKGFLPGVVEDWERAADPARDAGVRVASLRFGVVLSGNGGMLDVIKIPFKLGLGGRIGGNQYMSWIDLYDLVRIFLFVIEHPEIEGPVNAVSPEPVTNEQFTEALGAALNRATVIPVPASIARRLGGGLVEELLLADQHAVPAVLENAGFVFEQASIDVSLEHAFRK